MASLEAPSLEGETAGRRMFDLTRGILYWQGYFPDGPNMDLYYIGPRWGRLLASRPRLREALRTFRTFYPWILLGFMCVRCLVIHPMSIYTYWDSKSDVIDNSYATAVWAIVIVSASILTLRKSECSNILLKLEALSKEENLDNEYQRQLMKRMNVWVYNVTKYTHLIVNTFVVFSMTFFTVKDFLPLRKLYMRCWYPYDVSASPAFEITLAIYCIQLCTGFVVANTFISSSVLYFIYLVTLFKILTNKFLKIREIAVKRVLARKRGKDVVSHIREIAGERVLARRCGKDVVSHVSEIAGERVLARRCGKDVVSHVREIAGERVLARRCGKDVVSHVREQGLGNGVTRGVSRGHRPVDRYQLMHSDEFRQLVRHERTKQQDEVSYTDGEVDVEMKDILKNFVQFHQEILSLKNDVHSVFEVYFVGLSLLNVFIFGGTLILLTSHDKMNMMEIIILLISFEAVLIFFVFNVLCNMISDQAAAVSEAVYACDWLTSPTTFKRSLCIIITLTNNPVEFKPVGHDPFSLQNFGQVSNMAYKMTATLNSIIYR